MADGDEKEHAKSVDASPDRDDEDHADVYDGASNASLFTEFWMQDLVEYGNAEALQAALNEDEDAFMMSLKEIDDMGCTPLHTAVLYPNADVLALLWGFGPDALGLETACNGTPLLHLVLRMCTFAIHREASLSFLRQLLATESFMETAVTGRDDVGNTIFHLAAMANVAELFSTLDPKAALLEARNRMGERPLHVAVKFGSMDVLQTLVHDHHVDVHAATPFGVTPLHLAATLPAAADMLTVLDPHWKTSTVENGLGHTPHDVFVAAAAARLEPPHTSFLYHPDAMEHLPMAGHTRGKDEPPPENFERMKSLVCPGLGVLRTAEFDGVAWDHAIPRADIGDVLRVHEMAYVDKLKTMCDKIPHDVTFDDLSMYCLDADTALSTRSLDAAFRAAGNVCAAVDKVLKGDARNAFCVVRPPGHHAGPVGKVTCEHDRLGSNGFCLLNNVAIGAAYARSHFKAQGIDRIAILDFDVHHGNGTEECVRHLVPRVHSVPFETPYSSGTQRVHQYKPWRSADDAANVYFCSVHGYGKKDPKEECPPAQYAHAWFYPGSGETNIPLDQPPAAADGSSSSHPLIVNVGLPYQRGNLARQEWRRVFRNVVLPQVMAFKPDLIFLSAGFDGHRAEMVNWGYVGLMEHDYEWLTQSVVKVANSCCNGRVVSVLEGGYNFHGRVASSFCRSVAAHARALVRGSQSTEMWDEAAMAHEAKCEEALIFEASQKKASKRQSMDPSPTRSDEDVPVEEKRVSKRQRKEVDYVALAAELKHEM
ncbi:Aste57867_21859 [Aphanomyces stellatus]|uniref:Aste57867_21859 protein n=1 Tax=Aphanomyces stellatus TaxID=120398 RepID=A0A485LKQ3_9STRA|nr:hypothetical protein As57867_021790 [Aphanomyces stellatus]VFT98528.1 Aste57867_21859 [Aphanomyces stellatus]